MTTYRSLTGRTVPAGEYMVTVDPGLQLPTPSQELEELVAQGVLGTDAPEVMVESPNVTIKDTTTSSDSNE
jgi:hypothetical protein